MWVVLEIRDKWIAGPLTPAVDPAAADGLVDGRTNLAHIPVEQRLLPPRKPAQQLRRAHRSYPPTSGVTRKNRISLSAPSASSSSSESACRPSTKTKNACCWNAPSAT